jgi:hypothetical protein
MHNNSSGKQKRNSTAENLGTEMESARKKRRRSSGNSSTSDINRGRRKSFRYTIICYTTYLESGAKYGSSNDQTGTMNMSKQVRN